MFKVRLIGIMLSLLVLLMSFFSVSAQQRGGGGFAPNPTATSVPRDSDGDGVFNIDDACPNEPGPRTNAGCPSTDNGGGRGNGGNGGNGGGGNGSNNPQASGDTDGDGMDDSSDNCPTVPGVAENNGCPGGPVTPDPCVNQTSTPSCDPPYNPPPLSDDVCQITSNGDFRARVREYPRTNDTEVLGYLNQGTVYAALEMVIAEDGSAWFLVESFELADASYAGKVGYVSATTVLSSNCPVRGDDAVGQGDAGSFVNEAGALCFMSFGFDASIWSELYPEVDNVHYASFWFAFVPGTPIPAGTGISGVIAIEAFINLPDAENSVVVITEHDVFEAAQNAADGGEYGWPTLAGGIQSGDVILPRLTDNVGAPNDGTGRCGPIVAEDIDDLASESSGEDHLRDVQIDEFACTVHAGLNSNKIAIFAFNRSAGEEIPAGEAPIAVIVAPNAVFEEVENETFWTAQKIYGGIPTPAGVMYFDLDGWGLSLYRLYGAAGGTCGPIVYGAGETPANDTGTSAHVGGANFAMMDGSVRFVRDSINQIDECEEGWIYDIYDGYRSDVFYCSPQGLANQTNTADSAPPSQPVECPEEWVGDIYASERADIFVCSPTGLATGNPTGQTGLGIECPDGWVHDIYESEVSAVFYCRPTGFATRGEIEIQDDVIVDGSIITAENLDGFGVECPTDWIYDIYTGYRNDVFYCAPMALSTRE